MKNIRSLAFWILDFLRGGEIRKQYNEIQENNSVVRQVHLKEILSYAINHVPYYQGKDYCELKDFPIMSKPVFKKEKERCISNEFPHYEKLHTVKTSGSTGTPLVVYLDPRKRRRVIADLLVINDKIGWNLGHHYVFMRNWASNYRQSKFMMFFKNFTPIGVVDFDDFKKENLYSYLLKHKNSILVGYSLSVCDFMAWIKRTGKNARVLQLKLIHCSAEELPENKRKELRTLFGCPIYNRYSDEEVGLIAMMMDNSDVFTVNTASIRVELLKINSDEYVQPGEIGRVVVTDLFNKAMPLIRYDVGDLAVSNDSSDDIKTITKLCGRSADVLYTSHGVLVGNTTVSVISEIFPEIEKYQLAQVKKNKFEFRYIGILKDAEKNELRERLQMSLGEDSEIVLLQKSSLPASKNGKFKTIIKEKFN